MVLRVGMAIPARRVRSGAGRCGARERRGGTGEAVWAEEGLGRGGRLKASLNS